ncbi:carbohydrate binding family 9 domain-containing protein [candidate division KSB1 bacterium]|nr:carbohydrate binding family 9 domain-containing protein [candidate division KSB1 bacterium]
MKLNVLIFSILLMTTIFSQSYAGDDDPSKNRKQIKANKINPDPPRLDGFLDDEVWQHAEFTSEFFQKDPNEGEPAMHKTEVGFMYDESSLYIAARMYFENPDEIHAYVTRRDKAGNSARIIISLDTYLDRRTAYTFGLTAGGSRFDYYHPSDHERRRESSFDPVWEGKAQMTDYGWSAEMQIPFSQLRFKNQDEQIWGVNINRWIPNTNEDLYWVLIPKDDTGWSSKFGNLVGISGIQPSRRIELLPYSASSAKYTSDADPLDPFNDGSKYDSRVGLDLKMGLGSNLTLDATVNPDFGQVEADPAVVNLSAFETFFRERRTFFIEGRQLFDNNGPTFFYSRRIGARPHGSAEADFLDNPDNTTIIGAAKITGRLNSGLSIGVLSAVTSTEHADTFTAATDSTAEIRGKTKVEPLNGFGVVRLQQEFGASQSTVGLMLTGVKRDVSNGSALAEILNKQAYTGNFDWNLRFQGGKYVLSGYAGFSHINGDPLAIVGAQRSSARYYQRPDATHVRLDSARTSLSGYAASVRFNKNSGEHWLWGTGISTESPAFELNDAGILSGADGVGSSGFLTYRETKPGKLFRDYSFDFSAFAKWNFEGIRTFGILDFFFNSTFKNFWNTSLHYHYLPQNQSWTATRGGPLMATASNHHVMTRISNNRASNFNWRTRVSYIWNDLDGFDFSTSARFSFKPTDALELSLEPEYERERTARQYFDEFGNGRDVTFGQRYVFSAIDRSTLSTQIRLNYAITPDLSLELYAEPFAASGKRFDFGELLKPRSKDLRFYGTDGTTITENGDGFTVTDGTDTFELENRDFNIRSFRSNFVLRWEWRRGSTLFLVWQQDRSSSEDQGSFVTPGSLFDSLSARGDNFLALKVSYWLPVK